MPLLRDQARYLYTRGRSIRDLQAALDVLFGHVRSRAAVNRVTRAARSPMDTWRPQPITAPAPLRLVDGVWGQVLQPTGVRWIDQSGHERREMRGVDQVILTVMGVWPAGRPPILHDQLARAEDTPAWSDRLATVIARGLAAATGQMGVSAGSTGLPAALATHLPTATQPRCVVHKLRGLERAFCYRDLRLIDPLRQEPLTHEAARRLRRQHLRTAAQAIFAAPTRAEADARLAAFRTTWGSLEAAVVRLLTKAVDACLTCYQFDQPLHRLIRSTNLRERFFREFRTTSDEMGAFPNDSSCLVVVHLIGIRDDAKHDRGHTAKTG